MFAAPEVLSIVTYAIEVEDLVRSFTNKRGKKGGPRGGKKDFVALDGVSLSVDRGEARGLLGPNGAGKTTLVKVLSTVLLPTSGQAKIFGLDVITETAAVRREIGVVFGGERGLYGRLSVRQNLEYWAAAYLMGRSAGRARTTELIEQFGLAKFADTPVDRISRGMKQRVHLARGVMPRPSLLFLDEPTIGLDPVASAELYRLLADLRQSKMTILLTTHDMVEAERLCDKVTLIDHGRILGTESPQEIGGWITAHERVEARITDSGTIEAVHLLPGVVEVTDIGADWVRISTDAETAVADILALLLDRGITTLRVGSPSLQEVYLELMGARGMTV